LGFEAFGLGEKLMGLWQAKGVDIFLRGFLRDLKGKIVEK